MANSRLGYLAVKKETTRAVAVKPTNFIRFNEWNIEYNQDLIENNPIQNVRWNAITPVKGKVSSSGSFSIDGDVRDIGYFLMAALGTYAVSTLTTGVYKHTFNTANKLPSLSLEQLQGDSTGDDMVVSRAFGVMVDKISLTGSDGIIGFKADVKAHGVFLKANVMADASIGSPATIEVDSTEWLVVNDAITVAETTGGSPSSENTTVAAVTDTDTLTANLAAAKDYSQAPKIELRPQTPSYASAQEVFSFNNAKFQFGTDLTAAASASEENVENWTLEYMNNLGERYGSKRKTPSVIAEKGAAGTFKYTKFFETRTDRDRYLDQTRQACILTLQLEKKIGSTAYYYSLVIKMSDLRFKAYKMNTGVDSVYVAELETALFYDQTDGKAVLMELTNDVADYAV